MDRHDPTFHTPDREAGLEKLRELIKGMHVAMLTTQAEDGRLLSRPLGTQGVERDGDLWFVTGFDSEKVREIEANPQVNVAYSSKDKNTYVSIAGLAGITRDRATIEAHWTPAMSIFFPDGKDDPNLCMLRVQAQSAEYWDGPGSAAGKALYFLMTAVNKNPGNLSENVRLDLQ
ncbi:pyridoxamine 5'-phosphate oxidase family protein [Lysobacter humi (ex Lee et al. 2017)]